MSGCGDVSPASVLVDQFGNPIGVPGNPLNVGAIVVPTPLDVVIVGGGLNFEPAMMDAFGRMRVSEPQTLFDSKQVFNDQAIFFNSQTATGGTVTYQSARASSYLTVTTTNGSLAARQTKRYFNYQPGKALKHGEPVLTPLGWVKIEDCKVGDVIFDGLGDCTKVTGVFPQGPRQIYRVTFDDGTHVDCDGDHLWKTIGRQNSAKDQVRVLTTLQMLEEYGEEPPQFARWRIPAAPTLQIEERDVPIDPYTLGAILGDGSINKGSDSVRFTSADKEVVSYLQAATTKHTVKYSYGILGMGVHIKTLGLSGRNAYDKFVPDLYKYNSIAVRSDILQGLMDTDGTVDKRDGTASFTSVSQQLAEDVAYLVRSLGGQAKIGSRYTHFTNAGERTRGALAHRVSVIMPICPFRLGRKVFYWKPRTRISFDRYVHTIKLLGEYEATCIRVASDDHTFLTRGHIVTHNSQQVFQTFVMGAADATLRQRAGYFDANNGIFLQQVGAGKSLVLRTAITGAPSDANAVTQNNWNLDPLNGFGPSGITLDLTKGQVMVLDFEWLGLGLVRIGFVLNTKIIYAHVFQNPNNLANVYMQTPNLPVRWEIERIAGGAGVPATLEAVCCSVVSEGGQQPVGATFGADRAVTSIAAPTATYIPIIAIRLKAGQLRRTVIPLSFQMHDTAAAGTANYRLLFNPTRGVGTAPTWTSADANSSVEFDVTSTQILTNGHPLTVGYAQGRITDAVSGLPNQITLGAQDVAGTIPDELVLAARSFGGSADACLGAINWVEL